VAQLIRLLDDHDTQVREQATNALSEKGEDAIASIIRVRLKEKDFSPETDARIPVVLGGVARRLPWPFDAKEAVKRQSEFAKALKVSKELNLDLGNKLTMKLILIPPGRFVMGSSADDQDRQKSEVPQHEAVITKAFYLGIYPVTQEQYQQITGNNPSPTKASRCPVEAVSWDDAIEFCNVLSEKTGESVRLPTEAEWEYACRAGTETRFYYGNDTAYARLADYAWYEKNSSDAGEKHLHPVGQKIPNAWGLHDMHGNIFQWCSDLYLDDYYARSSKIDPPGPEVGNGRVMRGGDYYHWGWLCRSAYRNYSGSAACCGGFGFRVVVNVK
jgi:formylglycine-generating enzyme required for sulfatase activity